MNSRAPARMAATAPAGWLRLPMAMITLSGTSWCRSSIARSELTVIDRDVHQYHIGIRGPQAPVRRYRKISYSLRRMMKNPELEWPIFKSLMKLSLLIP